MPSPDSSKNYTGVNRRRDQAESLRQRWTCRVVRGTAAAQSCFLLLWQSSLQTCCSANRSTLRIISEAVGQRSTAVMKHVSVQVLPALNGAAMQPAWRARASRRTGGKLIMWKMRAVASVRGADGDRWGASTFRSQVLAWLGTKPAPRSSIMRASLPPLPVTPPQLNFLSSSRGKNKPATSQRRTCCSTCLFLSSSRFFRRCSSSQPAGLSGN